LYNGILSIFKSRAILWRDFNLAGYSAPLNVIISLFITLSTNSTTIKKALFDHTDRRGFKTFNIDNGICKTSAVANIPLNKGVRCILSLDEKANGAILKEFSCCFTCRMLSSTGSNTLYGCSFPVIDAVGDNGLGVGGSAGGSGAFDPISSNAARMLFRQYTRFLFVGSSTYSCWNSRHVAIKRS